jgi:hypothetical protein
MLGAKQEATMHRTPQPTLRLSRRTLLAGLASSFALTACSSYTLTNVWREPEFKGPPIRKVLVLGVSASDVNRRIFEDGFAQALQTSGTTAMVSYPLLPDRGQIPDDKIRGAIAQSGAEAVLITRLLRVDREVSVTPATPTMMYGRGFYGWYGSAWSTMPQTVNTYNVLTIETTLWNPRTEKPLWTGTTQSTEVSDVNKATAGLAAVLIERMKKDGVI